MDEATARRVDELVADVPEVSDAVAEKVALVLEQQDRTETDAA